MTDTGSPPIQKLAVIGGGLIGSSVLRAVRDTGAAQSTSVFDASAEVRGRLDEIGCSDQVVDTLSAAVADADLVILAVPVGAFASLAGPLAEALRPGTILSDVGSVKSSVFEMLAPACQENVHLIPAHPVAGTEKSGPDAGFGSLFQGRWCILTPPDNADPSAVDRLAAFWRALGSDVEIMSAQHHDLVLAITSHVPHLIAYNIVGTASDLEKVTNSEVIKYSAGGFRDFTRIAASDPVMWRDVFLHNREAVLEMLGRFSEDLTALQRAIRYGDGDGLETLFTRTRAIRRQIIDAGQDSAEADFGRAGRGEEEGEGEDFP
ncbi:MAG: prephenate/arogenate dehydrogenase family protein [Pseudomonadota bacterium]